MPRLVYSIKGNLWSQIANMNDEIRLSAACTVYEGKVVVTGGYNSKGLKSVEAYDYH